MNIVQFTKEFNARTADQGDMIIPVVITVYADRSFSSLPRPAGSSAVKKACGLKTAAANSKKEKVATIKRSEVQKIAELKMPDLTAGSLDAAISMIAGTARSMGITVVDD